MNKPIDVDEFLSQLADDNLVAAELHKASIDHINARLSVRGVVEQIDLHKKDMEILIADALEWIEDTDGLGAQERQDTIRRLLHEFAEDTSLATDTYRTHVARITNHLREVDEANRVFWAGMPAPRDEDDAAMAGELCAGATDELLDELRARMPAADFERLEQRLRETDQ